VGYILVDVQTGSVTVSSAF